MSLMIYGAEIVPILIQINSSTLTLKVRTSASTNDPILFTLPFQEIGEFDISVD